MNVVHMEKGPIGKTLLRFAIPILITQLLQELYNMADCMVVGHYAGENALAAVGLAGLVLSVLINFCVGFASGISAISARLFGSQDYSKLRALMVSVIRSAIWIGLVFSMLGLSLSGKLLTAIKCPAAVYTQTSRYLRICFLGLTAQLIYNAGAGLLRSLGDTRSTMVLFLMTSLLNLLLDVVFVVAMHMGVAGAAAATMLSQWIAALLIVFKLMRLPTEYALRFRRRGLQAAEFQRLLREGVPAGMQALFMSISSLLVQTTINHFGPDAIAGMSVYAKLEGCLYLPSFAYGIALVGFVGQNLGAKAYDRIRAAFRVSVLTMAAVIVPLSLILMLTAPWSLRLFTADPNILRNACQAVRMTFPFYVIYSINQVYLGVIKGLGNTTWPMICTLICYSLFRVLWCRLLAVSSMAVVYSSYDISFVLMLLMLAPVYRRMMSCLQRDDNIPR